MSLETDIQDLTAAIKENTAAVKSKGGGSAAASDGATAGKTKPKAAAATKFTADQVRAGVNKVKDEVGLPAAKKIIADAKHPGLKELLLDAKCFDTVMAAVEAALKPADDDDDGLGGTDDDDDL